MNYDRLLTLTVFLFGTMTVANANAEEPSQLGPLIAPWNPEKSCHSALNQCGAGAPEIALAALRECRSFTRCMGDCRSKTFERKRNAGPARSCAARCMGRDSATKKACLKSCRPKARRTAVKKRGRRKCHVACRAQFEQKQCAEARGWLWDKTSPCLDEKAPLCLEGIGIALKYPWPPRPRPNRSPPPSFKKTP